MSNNIVLIFISKWRIWKSIFMGKFGINFSLEGFYSFTLSFQNILSISVYTTQIIYWYLWSEKWNRVKGYNHGKRFFNTIFSHQNCSGSDDMPRMNTSSCTGIYLATNPVKYADVFLSYVISFCVKIPLRVVEIAWIYARYLTFLNIITFCLCHSLWQERFACVDFIGVCSNISSNEKQSNFLPKIVHCRVRPGRYFFY